MGDVRITLKWRDADLDCTDHLHVANSSPPICLAALTAQLKSINGALLNTSQPSAVTYPESARTCWLTVGAVTAQAAAARGDVNDALVIGSPPSAAEVHDAHAAEVRAPPAPSPCAHPAVTLRIQILFAHSAAPRRIAPRRVAPRRVASRRVVSHWAIPFWV